MRTYGAPPLDLGFIDTDLREVMYYLYLPIALPREEDPTLSVQFPRNVQHLDTMVHEVLEHVSNLGLDINAFYVYLSARKGWATRDNPLNRPGWHCDGFGTDDLNFVWWRGPGTRFAVGEFQGISPDHRLSMEQFEEAIARCGPNEYGDGGTLVVRDDYPEGHLYAIDPHVVHATPVIGTPCWRQYVKVSVSRHRYNLENNSHNYLFDYEWPMHSREEVRNDTYRAQRDYA